MTTSKSLNLNQAKAKKNDEFYTQYDDIQREINAYTDYDPDVFRGKTILLPCDDPEWSNFTKFFALNFEAFGLKKLISTSYAADSKKYDSGYQPTFFESNDKKYDNKKTRVKGKIFTLESGVKKADISSLKWDYLKGDGDFNSDEVRNLRDEADMIITNPPFSLFLNFMGWMIESEKKFLVIGSLNAIGCKEIFPLIKENKVWLGYGFNGGNAYFKTAYSKDFAKGVYDEKTGLVKFRNVVWITNLQHGRRHEKLPLMTEADVIKFSTKKPFEKYDNYDAIEVSKVKNIPSDWGGV